MRILDVGCGRKKVPGSIGLDLCVVVAPDVVCDLNRTPYPFASSTFDKIVLNKVIEHLPDVVLVMNELHRIGKPGCDVLIKTPHFSSLYSWQDPTHRHHLAYDSFDYFTEATKHSNFYTGCRYEMVEKNIQFGKSFLALVPWLLFRLSKHKYEKHFAFMFPANDLTFHLKVVK
ncbi:MAG: methyltransferase domain-containing protein [Deltaproteobacteria bacterium]|nr:methyltransferase domain-containing protein [Deltaproteobacteria bacterium]